MSTERPIFVFHASAHLATVNSAMLERHKITADSTTPGVARGSDGEPNGELQEMPAIAEEIDDALEALARALDRDPDDAEAHFTMAKALERRNLQAALKRVRKNKGSAGIDGMTADGLPVLLRPH